MKWKANEHPDDKPDETGAYVGVFVGNQGTEEYVKWSIEKCVADQLGMNPSEDGHGQKAERTVADVVNNWIEKKSGETNPHINDVVDNNDDEFYAVKFGKSSASDILVVHDKDKHNIDKKNVGINDRTFFIEVKDGAS